MDFVNTSPTKLSTQGQPLEVVFKRPAEKLVADRTLTDADDQKVFFAEAVDLTLTLHSPPSTSPGFRCSVIVQTVSTITGFTIAGAINGGSTSAVNAAATDAKGDRFDLWWNGSEWLGQAVHGTWNVT